MMEKKQISILGCGWLGLALAKSLIAQEARVKGSTTSKEKIPQLNAAGIEPFLIELSEQNVQGNISAFLSNSKVLVINVPPGLRGNPNKDHVSEIQHLIAHIETTDIAKVIYASSISVYGDSENLPTVNEQSRPNPDSESGKQLLKIEELLLSNPNFSSIILRFGGLFGADRHPATYLSGRKNLKNPNAPVNLIHREDCIGIISELIVQDLGSTVLNAAIPEHPSKKNYYTAYCKNHDLPLPEFDERSVSIGKSVSSEKLVQLLNYQFKIGL